MPSISNVAEDSEGKLTIKGISDNPHLQRVTITKTGVEGKEVCYYDIHRTLRELFGMSGTYYNGLRWEDMPKPLQYIIVQADFSKVGNVTLELSVNVDHSLNCIQLEQME